MTIKVLAQDNIRQSRVSQSPLGTRHPIDTFKTHYQGTPTFQDTLSRHTPYRDSDNSGDSDSDSDGDDSDSGDGDSGDSGSGDSDSGGDGGGGVNGYVITSHDWNVMRPIKLPDDYRSPTLEGSVRSCP